MSGANVTETELLAELQRKRNGVVSAKHALGIALLKGGADVHKLRCAHAKSLQAVTDAEAMLDALGDYTEGITSVRRLARRTTNAPRVTLQEYADTRKRFEREYTSLRKTPGVVLARGKELLELAEHCGQRALSDVRTRFKGLPASPELHNL